MDRSGSSLNNVQIGCTFSFNWDAKEIGWELREIQHLRSDQSLYIVISVSINISKDLYFISSSIHISKDLYFISSSIHISKDLYFISKVTYITSTMSLV